MKSYCVSVKNYDGSKFENGSRFKFFWFRSKRDALFGASLLALGYDVFRIHLEGSDGVISTPDLQLSLYGFDEFFVPTFERGFKEFVRK